MSHYHHHHYYPYPPPELPHGPWAVALLVAIVLALFLSLVK